MPVFTRLDDTPMFKKRLQQLEEASETLRDRSHKLLKGTKKYADSLSYASTAELAFAKTIDAFGTAGGSDDPISIAVGGPVMSRFVEALRELKGYKDVLKSQVDHMMVDRIAKFKDHELHNLRDVRKKLERSSHQYDQARERFLSLKKDCKPEVVHDAENELQVAKINYEQARFAFASAACSIEAKKKYEYVESVACTLDAHLRYFKQGYELLMGVEPFIQQVLTFSQQAREAGQQELLSFSTQVDEYLLSQQKEQEEMAAEVTGAPGQGPFQPIGGSSQKAIEEMMASSVQKGKVQVIRQGYLLKRSSNLRGDWQRRFFVLDSRGMLYYYRKGSVLSLKQSTTPLNSPPTSGMAGGPAPSQGQTGGSGVSSLIQSSMQGVSNLILNVRSNHGAPGNSTAVDHHPPDSPMSPSVEPPPLTPTSSTSSVASQPQGPFSMFSRVLNPKKEASSSALSGINWRGFGGGGVGGGGGGGGGGASGHSQLSVSHSAGGSSFTGGSSNDLGAREDSQSRSVAAAASADSLTDIPSSYSLVSACDSVSSTPRSSPPRESAAPAGTGALGVPAGMQEFGLRGQDCHVLNLLTATIKMDAEQSDLRFCFRIVTPTKTYTLQAENAAERKDWVDKITAVIASLLNAQMLGVPRGSDASAFNRDSVTAEGGDFERPIDALQAVPGNAVCVDCGKEGPDWASLNLGVLMCIECSGIHRNLGVQLSKVRSLTLDVRVWEEAPVIAYFRATGNSFANSLWEEALSHSLQEPGEEDEESEKSDSGPLDGTVRKPGPDDVIQVKEKFILLKYVERRFVVAVTGSSEMGGLARSLWLAVQFGNVQKAMRLLVCARASPNITREEALGEAPGEEIVSPMRPVPSRSSTFPERKAGGEGEADGSTQEQGSLSPVPRTHSERFGAGDPSQADPDSALGSQRQDSGSRTPEAGSKKSLFAGRFKKSFVRSTTDVAPAQKVKPKVAAGAWSGSSRSEEHTEGSTAGEPGQMPVGTSGPVVSALSERGWTLLHLACSQGDLGSVEMLLQHGAQLDARDDEGRTPMHCTLLMGHLVCARHLASRGADPHVLDHEGLTPLESYTQHGGVLSDPALLALLT